MYKSTAALLLLVTQSLAQIVPVNVSTNAQKNAKDSVVGSSISSLTQSSRNQVQNVNFESNSVNYNLTISPCAFQLDQVIGDWTFKNGSFITNVTWQDLNDDAGSNRTAEGSLINSWKSSIILNANALATEIEDYLSPYICNVSGSQTTGLALPDTSSQSRKLQQVFGPLDVAFIVGLTTIASVLPSLVYHFTVNYVEQGETSLNSLDPEKVFQTAKLLSTWSLAVALHAALAINLLARRRHAEVVAGMIALLAVEARFIITANAAGVVAASIPGNCFNQAEIEQFAQTEASYTDPTTGVSYNSALSQIPSTCFDSD